MHQRIHVAPLGRLQITGCHVLFQLLAHEDLPIDINRSSLNGVRVGVRHLGDLQNRHAPLMKDSVVPGKIVRNLSGLTYGTPGPALLPA